MTSKIEKLQAKLQKEIQKDKERNNSIEDQSRNLEILRDKMQSQEDVPLPQPKKKRGVRHKKVLQHYESKAIDKTLPLAIDGGRVKEKDKWDTVKWWHLKKKGLAWIDRRRLKKKPETSFLIRFLFSNGTSKEFVISTTEETFRYKKRTYHLRYENSFFNLTQNQFELTYFDDFVEPLDRKIIRKGNEAFWGVTPENLKPLIEMNYLKVLASQGELDRYLKMNAILTVVLLFFNFFFMFMLFYLSRKMGKIISAIGTMAGGG